METNKSNKPPTPKTSSLLTWLFYALIALLILLIGYKAFQERKANQAAMAKTADMNEALRDDVGYVDADSEGSEFDAKTGDEAYPDDATEKPTINDGTAITDGPEMKDTGIEAADATANEPTSTSVQDEEGKSLDVDEMDYDEPTEESASDGTEGAYMVITGTFRQMIHAEEELKKLVKKGYGDAEIGKFNRGAFACTIAYRTNDLGEARAVASRLRRAGYVEAFVKKKN